MTILLNSAGGSAADPALKNLGMETIVGSSTMDVATIGDVWVDTNNTFPGTNSVKASLSPAATVVTSGAAATYSDTTKQYALVTTGISAGDWVYLSHASLTAGLYEVLAIVDGTHLTLVSNPLNGQGDKTGIAFQVGWRYNGTAGTAPITSSAGGQINYLKARMSDSAGNQVDSSDSFYVRDAPAGSAFIAVDGKTYDGTATSNVPNALSLSILAAWTNKGGISHIGMANHSSQSVNNFTWGDSTTAEKTIAAAESGGLKASAGDGMKYGALVFKSKASAAITYSVDIAINIDTTAPTLVFRLAGR